MRNKGFAALEILVIVVVLTILAGGVWVWKNQPVTPVVPTPSAETATDSGGKTSEALKSLIIGYNLDSNHVRNKHGFAEFVIEVIGEEPFNTGLTLANFRNGENVFDHAISPDGTKVVVEGFRSDTMPQLPPGKDIAVSLDAVVDGLYIVDVNKKTVEEVKGFLPTGKGIAWQSLDASGHSLIAFIDKSRDESCAEWVVSETKPQTECLVLIDGENFQEVTRHNVWYFLHGYETHKPGDTLDVARVRSFLSNNNQLLLKGIVGFFILDVQTGILDEYRERNYISEEELVVDITSLPDGVRSWYRGNFSADFGLVHQTSRDGKFRILPLGKDALTKIVDQGGNIVYSKPHIYGAAWLEP